MSRLIYDFHFRRPNYILYNIHVDNILFKFIVLDMNYPHLYLSQLYIRAINDSDSNRAALNQMKIILTLYEVTIQESKITSYPAKIGQAKHPVKIGYAFTRKRTKEGAAVACRVFLNAHGIAIRLTNPHDATQFVSIFETKIFSSSSSENR